MFNILDQYEPIYFQNEYFNFFQGSKFLDQKRDSELLYKEVTS